MISRRMSPAWTALSWLAITSMCQFMLNSVRGLSSAKQRSAKLQKSEHEAAP
jgi:hypothetical protein